MDDEFIDGKETLMIFGLGAVITLLIQWWRGMFKKPTNNVDE